VTAARASVAVVIPTYERVEQTVAAVRSVQGQTVTAAAITVVDDGSSPETQTRLAAALQDLGVELVVAPRTTHPGRTRNLGVAATDTDWVAFLDSDDTWLSTKLETQLAQAARTGAAALYTGAYRKVDGVRRGLVVDDLPERLSFADLVKVNSVVNSTVLVRRSLLLRVGGVAEAYLVRGVEDYATWLRIATVTTWEGTPEPLIDYTDDVAAGVRGTEVSLHHPGQQSAWLDYLAWRRRDARPGRFAGVTLDRILPRALALDHWAEQRRFRRSGSRGG
jgi:glycosyltransferase involved in cell wall biosynthesis